MSIDRYIGMYFRLQRKAEEAPLSEEELEQIALCESIFESGVSCKSLTSG